MASNISMTSSWCAPLLPALFESRLRRTRHSHESRLSACSETTRLAPNAPIGASRRPCWMAGPAAWWMTGRSAHQAQQCTCAGFLSAGACSARDHPKEVCKQCGAHCRWHRMAAAKHVLACHSLQGRRCQEAGWADGVPAHCSLHIPPRQEPSAAVLPAQYAYLSPAELWPLPPAPHERRRGAPSIRQNHLHGWHSPSVKAGGTQAGGRQVATMER